MTRWLRLLTWLGLAHDRLTELEPVKKRRGYLWDHFEGNRTLIFNGRSSRIVDLWFPWEWND